MADSRKKTIDVATGFPIFSRFRRWLKAIEIAVTGKRKKFPAVKAMSEMAFVTPGPEQIKQSS